MEQSLLSSAPMYKSLNIVETAQVFREMVAEVGAGDPTVQKILGGKDPDARAAELVNGSKLDDAAFRKQIDVITIEYRDALGGLHGAIFTLADGAAQPLKERLVSAGAKAEALPPEPQPEEKK